MTDTPRPPMTQSEPVLTIEEADPMHALRLYRSQHDDSCGCEGCDAYEDVTSDEARHLRTTAEYRSGFSDGASVVNRVAAQPPVQPVLSGLDAIGEAIDGYRIAVKQWQRHAEAVSGEDRARAEARAETWAAAVVDLSARRDRLAEGMK